MLKNIFSQIVPIREEIKVDLVDCFEQPLGVVFNSFAKGLNDIYYLMLKYFQLYELEGLTPSRRPGFVFSSENNYLVEHLLSTKIDYLVEVPSNVVESVIELIDSGKVVFLPGNLRELFYSYHYKESNWMHLFLIKGYDREKEIFNVIDSVGEGPYRDFALTFEIAKNMYYSFCEQIKPVYLAAIDISKKTVADLEGFAIATFIELVKTNEASQICRPIKAIEDQIKKISDGEFDFDLKKSLVQTNQYYFFLQKLEKIISPFFDPNLLQEFLKDVGLFQEQFKQIKNRVYIAATRKSVVNYSESVVVLKDLHKKVFAYFEGLGLQLGDKVSARSENLLGNIENDPNKVINIQNKKILFRFDQKADYNFWVEDFAPKFIFNKKKYQKISVDVQTTITDFVLFHAGFIIKTKSRKSFVFGIYNSSKIKLEQMGVDSILPTKTIDPNIGVRFEITCTEDCLKLKALQLESVEEMMLPIKFDEVHSFGLLVKSWGDFAPFVVEFSNILIETSRFDS